MFFFVFLQFICYSLNNIKNCSLKLRMSSVNRSRISQWTCTLSTNLNYIPYRQKDQFFSPKLSIVSKRSSFSYRSPTSALQNKSTHKIVTQCNSHNFLGQKQNNENEQMIGNGLFTEQLRILDNEKESKKIEREESMIENKKDVIDKMEESMSITTQQVEENKMGEVFSEEQQNKINSNLIVPQKEIKNSECSQDIKNIPKLCQNDQKQLQGEKQQRNQIIQTQQTEETKQQQYKSPQKQQNYELKSIIRTNKKQVPHLPQKSEKKSVKFMLPVQQQNPQIKIVLPKSTHSFSNLNSASAAGIQKFSQVYRKLQKSNKQQAHTSTCNYNQEKVSNTGKKEQSKCNGNSRLLMRFKKKGSDK